MDDEKEIIDTSQVNSINIDVETDKELVEVREELSFSRSGDHDNPREYYDAGVDFPAYWEDHSVTDITFYMYTIGHGDSAWGDFNVIDNHGVIIDASCAATYDHYDDDYYEEKTITRNQADGINRIILESNEEHGFSKFTV